MRLTGAARLAAVIGDPIAHSRSPTIHSTWLERHGIDGAYIPLRIRSDDLGTALRLLPRMGFRGANVTVPHKEAVLAHLDDIDEPARLIGAVNTIHMDLEGRLSGTNTDAYGFAESLAEARPHGPDLARPGVLLGAGGAARAVAYALLSRGLPALTLVNRGRARAEALCADLARLFSGRRLGLVDPAGLAPVLAEAGLLVNATSLGMSGMPPLDIDLAPLPAGAVVVDIVYKPLETALLQAARARGLATLDGLWMLIHQARPGFRVWFGVDPSPDARLHADIAATL